MDTVGTLLYQGLQGRRGEKRSAELLLSKLIRGLDNVFTPEAAWRWLEASYGLRPDRTGPSLQRGSGMLLSFGLEDWASTSSQRAARFYSRLLKSIWYAPRPMHQEDNPFPFLLPPLLANFGSLVVSHKDRPARSGLPARSIILALEEAAANQEAKEVIAGIALLFASHGYELDEKRSPLTLEAKQGLRKSLSLLGERWIKLEQSPDALRLNLLVDQKQAEIEAFSERIWSDVVLRGRCDVRPGGLDAFAVKEPLDEISGSYRYFIRGGFAFPEVGVVALEPWFGREMFQVIRLSTTSLAYSQKLCNLAVVDFLVNSVVYHRLICHEPEGKTRPEIERVKVGQEAILETEELIREQVRMHLRRLRPGWQPSEEKKEEALKCFGRELPPGYTLVNGFERGRKLHHRLEDENIRKIIDSHPDLPEPSFSVDPIRILEKL